MTRRFDVEFCTRGDCFEILGGIEIPALDSYSTDRRFS